MIAKELQDALEDWWCNGINQSTNPPICEETEGDASHPVIVYLTRAQASSLKYLVENFDLIEHAPI